MLNNDDGFWAAFALIGSILFFGVIAELESQAPQVPAVRPVAPLIDPMPPGDRYLSYELLAAHNAARGSLPKLETHVALVAAARAHADHMAKVGRMAHDRIGDGTYISRLQASGYHFHDAGENVAAGQMLVEDVMISWMRSPLHRANILGSQYTQFGGAVAYGRDGTPYWCAVFGKPMK